MVFEIIVQRSGFLNDCSKILSIFSMYSYLFAHLLSWSFIIKSHKLNFAQHIIYFMVNQMSALCHQYRSKIIQYSKHKQAFIPKLIPTNLPQHPHPTHTPHPPPRCPNTLSHIATPANYTSMAGWRICLFINRFEELTKDVQYWHLNNADNFHVSTSFILKLWPKVFVCNAKLGEKFIAETEPRWICGYFRTDLCSDNRSPCVRLLR